MSHIRAFLFASAMLLPSLALAQSGAVPGAIGGAAAGAAVGGPVGAAVGGVAGAIAGSTLAPPPAEVDTYVLKEQRPSVAYTGSVVVGDALPDTVTLYEVPSYPAYRYTVVNNARVIVDPKSRKIVKVLR